MRIVKGGRPGARLGINNALETVVALVYVGDHGLIRPGGASCRVADLALALQHHEIGVKDLKKGEGDQLNDVRASLSIAI